MRNTAARLLTITTTLAAVAGLTLAPAAASSGPVLLDPAPGSTVAAGFTGPLTVDRAGIADGTTYRVELDCPEHDPASLGELTQHPDPAILGTPRLAGGQTCTVWAHDTAPGGTSLDLGHLTVAHPVLSLGTVSVNTDRFYPLVRDGFRDTVTMRWTLNRPAAASVAVLDSRGRSIRADAVSGDPGPGSHTWDGRDPRGRVVAPGTYRLRLTAKASGVTRTAIRTVVVATDFVTRHGEASRHGLSSTLSTRGSCYATHDHYEEWTNLDCWGGRYAAATYHFKVPASAYGITFRVRGALADTDICCDGRITRTLQRPTSTRARVRVAVNGWRAYNVHGVTMAYKYKVRR